MATYKILRKQYGNSLDIKLYLNIKALAANLTLSHAPIRINANELIETGIYALENGLTDISRTTEKGIREDVSLRLNSDLYKNLRILALQNNLKANDLLERAMEFSISLEEDKLIVLLNKYKEKYEVLI